MTKVLLTQLDLAVLLNVCDAVSDYVNEWQKTTENSCPLGVISMIYRGPLPTRKRYSRSIFKDISPRGSPQRPNTLRRLLIDTFAIMRASKSFEPLPQILTKSPRLHDFLKRHLSISRPYSEAAPPSHRCKPRQFTFKR